MTPRAAIAISAVLLLLGVAAGAFGAHALRGALAPELLGAFQTAVQYHLVHGLAALAVAILWVQWPDEAKPLRACAWLLMLGIVLFSGSLYALALTGSRALGAITPFGGTAWIIAWALLAWTAWRHR